MKERRYQCTLGKFGGIAGLVSSTRGGVEIFKQFFKKKMIADNDEDSTQRKEENIMNDCIVIPILNLYLFQK